MKTLKMNNEMLEEKLNIDETRICEKCGVECEKCGVEMGKRLLDDEIVAYCRECNWVAH